MVKKLPERWPMNHVSESDRRPKQLKQQTRPPVSAKRDDGLVLGQFCTTVGSLTTGEVFLLYKTLSASLLPYDLQADGCHAMKMLVRAEDQNGTSSLRPDSSS